MSGGSRDGYYRTYSSTAKLFSSDSEKRKRAQRERQERLNEARSTMHEKRERPQSDYSNKYSANLLKSQITQPQQGVKRIYIFVIDNSGSNAKIAKHLRDSSEYLTSVMQQLDPEAQFAYVYGSDHCDGDLMTQFVDYHFPDETGAKILYSTCKHIRGAHGGDEAEGFECILLDVCNFKFDFVQEKHLVLISDQVAHGMGEISDDGCPLGQSWEDTKEKVYSTFDSFCVVGCSSSRLIGELQTNFLKQSRVAMDFLDLSSIPEHQHRLAMSGNALLFLVSRISGRQGVIVFLSFLYEKWLSDPVFGADTDRRAKESIKRFCDYLPYEKKEIAEILEMIIV